MPMSWDEAHGLLAEAICACTVGRFLQQVPGLPVERGKANLALGDQEPDVS